MRLTSHTALSSHGQWLLPLVKGRAGSTVYTFGWVRVRFRYDTGTFGCVRYGWIWFGYGRVSSGTCVLSWCSLSSIRSEAPDAGCQLPPRVDHGGTHQSTLNAAEPGKPVTGDQSVLIWPA